MVFALISAVSIGSIISDAGWFSIVLQTIAFGMVAAPAVASLAERSISLAKASAFFPTNPHVNVIRRWCYHGVRGVLLSSHLIAGRRYVTREGIDEFIRALNAPRASTSATLIDSTNDTAFDRKARAEKSAALATLG